MKAFVDFSIFTEESGAFGCASGEIDFPTLPDEGDVVSFVVFRAMQQCNQVS